MLLRIDMTSDTPIYQQIRNEIVFAVAKENLKPGDALPTVRQLAQDIGVNPMTVNKAYALLKDEGVIIIDRRHGARMKGASKQEITTHLSKLIDLIFE